MTTDIANTAALADRLVELRINDLATGKAPPLYISCGGEKADAYIYLSEDGVVSTGTKWQHEGTPVSEWHGRTLSWKVAPEVKGCVLVSLLESEEVRDLFETAYLGHSVEWNGHNHVGRLDEDARHAYDKLERIFADIGPDDCAWVWWCSEWLAGSDIKDIWPADVSLESAAADLCQVALNDGVHLLDEAGMESALVETMLDAYEAALDDGTDFEPSPTQRADVSVRADLDRLEALDAKRAELEDQDDVANEQ